MQAHRGKHGQVQHRDSGALQHQCVIAVACPEPPTQPQKAQCRRRDTGVTQLDRHHHAFGGITQQKRQAEEQQHHADPQHGVAAEQPGAGDADGALDEVRGRAGMADCCGSRATGSGFQASTGSGGLVSVAAAGIGSSSGGSSQINSGVWAETSSTMISADGAVSLASRHLTPDTSSKARRCSTACSATCACSSSKRCSAACEPRRPMRMAWPIPNPSNAPNSASLNDSSSIQPSTSQSA